MNSVLLGSEHVSRAMADPRFFDQMPEFSVLKNKINLVKSASTRGCSSCKERRIRQTYQGDFVKILNTLSTSAMTRLKRYLGADELLVNAFDQSTHKTVLKKY